MFRLTIKVFHRRYEGDKSYHTETIYVNESQLHNWLSRGDTEDVEIVNWCRA